MAEQHGLYKRSVPEERVMNNGGLFRGDSTLPLCQCSNSKLLSVEKVIILSLLFYIPGLGNVLNNNRPRSALGHGTEQGLIHKQIRGLKSF